MQGKLSKRKNRKLSRLTNEQLALDHEINVQREAWTVLTGSENELIQSLEAMTWDTICLTQKKIDKNKAKCQKIVSVFLKPL